MRIGIIFWLASSAFPAEWVASTYLGGVGGASAESVAVDKQGNIYVTGTTTSNTFPMLFPLQDYFSGSNDVFVTKFDPTGTRVIFSTYFGSWGDDRAASIAVDAEGNAYIAGFTTSPLFPAVNAAQPALAGGSYANGGDAFVVKLSADGQRLVYSTYWGGSGDDFGRSIAVDAAGNAYVAGSTVSLDFPAVNGVQSTRSGARDAFALKLNAAGEVVFSTLLGGGAIEEGYGIAADPEGNAVIVGTSASTDFPLVSPLQPQYRGGARDVFVSKIAAGGGELLFSTYLGGTGDDFARNLAVDGEGFLYITGYATSATYPTRDAVQAAYRGNRDFIVTKMAPDGQSLVWSTLWGGASLDDAYDIAVAEDGTVTVVGISQSLNFPGVNAAQPAIGSPSCRVVPCTADVAIAVFSPDGKQALVSSYLGGGGTDNGRGVAALPGGGAVVVGNTASANFPVANAYQAVNQGGGGAVAFVTIVR